MDSVCAPMSEAHVVFAVEVADRPGMVHSVAAVFADRGLSMESLVAATGRNPSRILIAFRGTMRQCRMVEQVLPRLHHVLRVQRLPIESPRLHALALCVLNAPAPPLPEVSVQSVGEAVLLTGSYAAVDRALAQLQDAGLVQELSRSLVAL